MDSVETTAADIRDVIKVEEREEEISQLGRHSSES